MNELSTISVGDVTLPIKEYNNSRVVTFKDIDTVHNRPSGTARKRFNDNRSRFIEGIDYYKISPSEFRTAFGDMDARQQNDVTLVAESGYLMLVKSFTDDLSWQVQRDLVNNYFRTKHNNFENFAFELFENTLQKYLNPIKDRLLALEEQKPSIPNFWSWKKNVANKVIDLICSNLSVNCRTAYDLVYNNMTLSYGFDKSYAMSKFCAKYKVSEVSTIDSIADVPEYAMMFINSAYHIIDNNTNSQNFNTVDGIITNSESAVDIIIKPLVERYQDKSCNNAKTFGRVYKNMRTSRSWKLLLSRRKCRTKKELIESDRKLMKEFKNTVEKLLQEE